MAGKIVAVSNTSEVFQLEFILTCMAIVLSTNSGKEQ